MAHVQTVLGQRYEVHEVLGRGAMGVVYRATDRVLGRDVAVKVLALERAQDPTFVARFEREALAVAALSDPRIVTVYDSGHDDEVRYIVMECIRGASLAQIVREHGPMALGRAVEIATQIAGALATAHRAGIIHRDIKPANVMVDERDSVKVLDFGIAKSAAAVSLTQTATVLGSAPYLAPEVIRGEPADARSDIYSLGCVLYELLTGAPPFTGEHAAAILHQHDSAQPPPLGARESSVPAAFEALVMQMLAKNPRSRPRSAEALRRALAASLGGPSTGTERDRGATAASAATKAIPRVPRPTRHRRRFSRGEAIALGAALAIMAAGLAIALGSGGSSPRTGNAAVARRHTGSPSARAKARAPSTTSRKHRATHVNAPAGTTQTPTSPQDISGPRTVAGVAGTLTTLVTEDYEHGTLDQQAAQQILSGLHDTLNGYDNANPKDAAHHMSDLSSHLEQLAAHGDIQPAALPAVTSAVKDLQAAVEQAAPPAPDGLGSGPPAGPKAAGGGPKGPKGPKGAGDGQG